MLKIELVTVGLEYWKKNHTCYIEFLRIEGSNYEGSLFGIGWYQGDFIWDFLYFKPIKWIVLDFFERRG